MNCLIKMFQGTSLACLSLVYMLLMVLLLTDMLLLVRENTFNNVLVIGFSCLLIVAHDRLKGYRQPSLY